METRAHRLGIMEDHKYTRINGDLRTQLGIIEAHKYKEKSRLENTTWNNGDS